MSGQDIKGLFLILILCGIFYAIKIVAIPVILCILFFIITGIIIWLYDFLYFRSESFLAIKNSLAKNTEDFNELNKHIEELKKAYVDIKSADYGHAEYYDNSSYDYKRPYLNKFVSDDDIHYCSLSVCKNAKVQPFKYFCKYFDVTIDENTLTKFEEVFNQFSAADEGIRILKKEREEIFNTIKKDVPYIIREFCKDKLFRELGFDEVKANDIFYPKYSFVYISAGGNSSMRSDILFNTYNLEKFIQYMSEKIKFSKSMLGQRALMTSSLRKYILQRDNYTCKNCGLSVDKEPNLLLEIDHIIPISKGGLTTEDNLQTLCWKCNRSKSNKLLQAKKIEDERITNN